jgi:hypothetical protein
MRHQIPAEHLRDFQVSKLIIPIPNPGKKYSDSTRVWVVKFKGEVVRDDFESKEKAVAFIREKARE